MRTFWLARDRASLAPVGHFQSTIKHDRTAAIGYVVAKQFQLKGFAYEALLEIFEHLPTCHAVVEVKAWTDTRNVASHRLASKLGMKQIEFIKDADFFGGQTSDEFVFAKDLGPQLSITSRL